MLQSKQQSEFCTEQIHLVEEELRQITIQVNDIDQKACMQADVVEKQTHFISSINEHVHTIHTLADSTDEKMLTSLHLASELKALTQNQRKLIFGFQR